MSIKLSQANNTTSITREDVAQDTTAAALQLDLAFYKVVGRPALGPLERDLIVSEEELKMFAEICVDGPGPVLDYCGHHNHDRLTSFQSSGCSCRDAAVLLTVMTECKCSQVVREDPDVRSDRCLGGPGLSRPWLQHSEKASSCLKTHMLELRYPSVIRME